MFPADEARAFLTRLHAGMDPSIWVAFALMSHPKRGRPFLAFGRPGELPDRVPVPNPEGLHVFFTPCAFSKRRRTEALALVAPCAWTDLDPPKAGDLEAWQREAWTLLEGTDPAPSMVVCSGRGFHAYWLLRPAVRLEGEEARGRLVAAVRALNAALARKLGGDTVHDLAHCLRLPGTVNPKNGARCELLKADGPVYTFEALVEALAVRVPETPAAVQGKPAVRVQDLAQPAPTKRGRGRPSKGCTKRDLRGLPPRIRAAVVGGAWQACKGGRMRGADGRPDRSRVDAKGMYYMLRAGWTFERIRGAFERPDWLIGAKYRELHARQGAWAALRYLETTVRNVQAWAAARGDRR